MGSGTAEGETPQRKGWIDLDFLRRTAFLSYFSKLLPCSFFKHLKKKQFREDLIGSSLHNKISKSANLTVPSWHNSYLCLIALGFPFASYLSEVYKCNFW